MKNKIIYAILVLFTVLSFALVKQTNAKQATKCWYNPQIEDCDTGGTVGCIDEAC